MCLYTLTMTYRRRNHDFNRTLAQRADELGTLTADSFQTNEHGRVIVSVFPAFTFACKRDAERFILRIVQANRQVRGKR
jgi:hypothetical protein